MPILINNLFLFGIPIGQSPQYVILIVLVLAILFLLFYFIPALTTWFKLCKANSNLKSIHPKVGERRLIEKNELSSIFKSSVFDSAWTSFKDTLHEQYTYEVGLQKLDSIRATAPAEAFFSQQAIIDSRINLEFFKHLPGILTGIGIIGTFWGLIHGIQSFDPSLLAKARVDPSQMDLLFDGLKRLFTEVQGAFIASAAAILSAMIVTLLEKISINACYFRLEQLCLKLDDLYEGGVAEDYLASLVKSSAENATQTTQLKQSLVTELSELLHELTDKQIKQSEAFAILLADKIQQQINENASHGELFRAELRNGLELMSNKVATVAGGQGETVTGMLEQLVNSFSQTISSTFSEQIQGVGNMINDASSSMQAMQDGFASLIQNLSNAGQQERQAANEKMLELVTLMESRQTSIQMQMDEFVTSINAQISSSQKESLAQMHASLNEIQLSTRKILEDMEQERVAAQLVDQQRHQSFSENMTHNFNTQIQSIGQMLTKTADTMQEMQIGFKVLTQDLKNTGEQERQAVGDKIMSLVGEIDLRQKATQGKVSDFVNEISAEISQGQRNNLVTMQENLQIFQNATRDMMMNMEQERSTSLKAERESQQAFAESSHQLISRMEAQMTTLTNKVSDTLVELQNNTTALNRTSINSIEKLNEGAKQITLAANTFVSAGGKMGDVFRQSEKVANQLAKSGGQIELASKTLEEQLKHYSLTRDLLAQMLTDMRAMLDRAKQEAGMSQQIVTDMQKMVASYGMLKDDMDDFVEQVSKLLADTVAKFQHDMNKHNAEFHMHHSDTLTRVASAYEPLSASISGLIDMISKSNGRLN